MPLKYLAISKALNLCRMASDELLTRQESAEEIHRLEVLLCEEISFSASEAKEKLRLNRRAELNEVNDGLSYVDE